jgi:hypothetical protein
VDHVVVEEGPASQGQVGGRRFSLAEAGGSSSIVGAATGAGGGRGGGGVRVRGRKGGGLLEENRGEGSGEAIGGRRRSQSPDGLSEGGQRCPRGKGGGDWVSGKKSVSARR